MNSAGRDQEGGVGDASFSKRSGIVTQIYEDVGRLDALDVEFPQLVLELICELERRWCDRTSDGIVSEFLHLFFCEILYFHSGTPGHRTGTDTVFHLKN